MLPVIGMIIATGAVLWYRGAKTPSITIPPPAPMPHPNAYDDFARAYSQFHDLKVSDYSSTSPKDLLPDLSNGIKGVTQARANHVAAENRTAITTLEHGLSEGYCAPDVTTFAQTLPYLAHDRAMARALSFDGRVAAHKGDWQRVIRNSMDSVELGTKIEHRGGVIAKLVGIASSSIGRVNAWAAVSHLNSKEATVEALRLERITDARTPFSQTLQTEEDQNTVCLLQEFKQQRPLEDMSGDDVFKYNFEEPVYFTFHPKGNSLQMYRQYMDTWVSTAKLPYPAAQKVVSPTVPDDMICNILCSVYNTVLFKDTADVANNRLLSTTLALRAYSLDHQGAYPATLSALTGRYLKHIPMDPFESGVIPLIYRRTSHGYLLYSIGPDGRDDGGKPFVHTLTDGTTTRRWCMPDDTGDIVAGINNG